MVFLMILLAFGVLISYYWVIYFLPRGADANQIPHLKIGLRYLMQLRLSTICTKAYAECRRRGVPIGTFRLFFRPVVFIADPALVNQVAGDWQNFRNRGSYHNDPSNVQNMHLFNMQDDQWKSARSVLGKYFSTKHLKLFVEVFNNHAGQCLDGLAKQRIATEAVKPVITVIDIFELAHKFSHSVAGHTFLSQDPTTPQRASVFDKLYNPGWFNKFIDVFGYVCPGILRWFNVCDIPTEVFSHLADTVRQAIETENIQDNSLLWQLNEEEVEQIVGYMIGLFVGSLKATTTFIAYACYELAKAPHFQGRVYQEMQLILSESETNNEYVEYEDLQDMKFMRHVLDETLRLHSGGPLLIRECNNTTMLCVNDLANIHIRNGTLIFSSIRDILKDEQFFAEAHTFNPDRFNDLTQGQSKFLPFGIGRHTCIGNRFVVLQAQVFLIRLLNEFEITLNEQCAQECLERNNKRLTDGFIYLNLTPRAHVGDIYSDTASMMHDN